MSTKEFVIFGTRHLGDTLVLSELIYNIKLAYEDSKVCLVVYPQWEYIAKLMNNIDKIVVLDKRGKHKGITGTLKLKEEIGYKDIYASIIPFRRQRHIWISIALGSKYILFNDINFFFDRFIRHSKYKITTNPKLHITTDTAGLLKGITEHEIVHIPIKLNKSNVIKKSFDINLTECVAINPIGDGDYKDLPLENLIDLISFFNKKSQKIILLGKGGKAQNYAEALRQNNIPFIDFVNKTSIEDLTSLLCDIKCLLTVDTGTAHLATYLGTKTLWLTYQNNIWAADSIYKNSDWVSKNESSEVIYKKMTDLISV